MYLVKDTCLDKKILDAAISRSNKKNKKFKKSAPVELTIPKVIREGSCIRCANNVEEANYGSKWSLEAIEGILNNI